MVWVAVLAASVGCYALKLIGLTVPRRLLANPRVRAFAMTVPIALLAALAAIQAVTDDGVLIFDPPRLGGLVAAAVALLFRAPFLVVLVVAAAAAATLRAFGIS